MTLFNQTIVSLNSSTINVPSVVQPDIKRAVIQAIGPNPDESKISSIPTVSYKILFPFGPNNMEFEQYNGTYNQIMRPFKKPLNVFTGGSLRVVTFEALIANRFNGGLTPSLSNGRQESVQNILDNLETISQTGATCDFIYGVTRLPYKCFLTEFSYVIVRRAADGQPLIANTSIQLTEKIEYNPNARLLPMIVRPPVGSSPGAGGTTTIIDEESTKKAVLSGLAGQNVATTRESDGDSEILVGK